MTEQPTRLAVGLAALGRPGYITLDHDEALGADRSVEAMRERTGQVLDAAYAAGVRHVDAARSYGRAEEFLASWLDERERQGAGVADVVVSSKWGYRYVGDWRVDAPVHEIKDHSAAAFTEQWHQTRALLGSRVSLYQVHSLTPDSPALGDDGLLGLLADLRDSGVRVGLSTSGPEQAPVLRTALEVTVGGAPLFSSVQATWNLHEPSVGPALAEASARGWSVLVKESLANGRLAGPRVPAPLAEVARALGTTPDAAAVAAALALPYAPTVLLGPVTLAHLRSNLAALDVDGAAVLAATGSLATPPADYWAARSALPWH